MKNHQINLDAAIEMTERFRSERQAVIISSLQSDDVLPVCETFAKEDFVTLVSNPDVEYVRIYYGMDENMKVHTIIVGANEAKEDILPADGGIIIEMGSRCPEDCPPTSPLYP